MDRLIKENKALCELSLTCPHDEADRAVNSCSSEITNEITKNARHRLAFFLCPIFQALFGKSSFINKTPPSVHTLRAEARGRCCFNYNKSA